MAHKSPSTLADSRPKHMSSPISLHGIDISSLDARDVFGLTMGSDLSSLPSASPDLSRAREDVDRQNSRSAHSPSLSAGRITDDDHISHFDPPPESRSRSVSTWIYPSRQPTGSSPALSIRAKDSDNPLSESELSVLLHASLTVLSTSRSCTDHSSARSKPAPVHHRCFTSLSSRFFHFGLQSYLEQHKTQARQKAHACSRKIKVTACRRPAQRPD